ncbi:MAG TPA: hypothetical protein ENI33_04560 [Thermoplasmatales archaeon]|nr:hypothetical protein [Thermoplasmatales archaeon]
MRRIFVLIILVSVTAILSIIGFIWLTSNPPTKAKAQLIIDFGIVHIKHGEKEWVPAKNGTILYQSDSVKTGNNTSAAIVLFKSSIIRLDSNTEISLQEILQQAGETNVKIKQDMGRTWNTILNISGIDNYDVQTPTTIVSIRGTSFEVNVSEEGETEVGVSYGTVKVSSIVNGSIIHTIEVNENESVIIDPDAIEEPLHTEPFERDDWALENEQKDEDFMENVKEELYKRIEPYIPELKERYGVTDEELEVLLDGYVRGYFDLPPETPDWIREIIELS